MGFRCLTAVNCGVGPGFGVYTSPCLETAAKYSGSDADGSGLLLVALAAPGRCWLERSSSETQEMIAEWFFPKQPQATWYRRAWVCQVGQAYKGWVWKGDGWHPSAEQHRDQLDMAFAPCEGLYDGRFHSRLFGHGTKAPLFSGWPWGPGVGGAGLGLGGAAAAAAPAALRPSRRWLRRPGARPAGHGALPAAAEGAVRLQRV